MILTSFLNRPREPVEYRKEKNGTGKSITAHVKPGMVCENEIFGVSFGVEVSVPSGFFLGGLKLFLF